MFIGHDAVGFAAKRFAPRTSLGWLIMAPLLADLLWPVFLLLGIEHVRISPGNTKFTPLDFYDYPWSHSLVMLALWGALLSGGYWLRIRYAPGSVMLFFGVLSHWVLDWLTHGPDMPLYPGGPKYGLGLWNNVPATLLVELLCFICGVAIYLRVTRPRSRSGSIGLWSYIAFLLLIYTANLKGTPPPSAKALAWVALAMWLFPLWAAWFDRHREAAD